MLLGKLSFFGNVEKIPTKEQGRFAIPISLVHPFLPVTLRYGVPFLPPRGRLWGNSPCRMGDARARDQIRGLQEVVVAGRCVEDVAPYRRRAYFVLINRKNATSAGGVSETCADPAAPRHGGQSRSIMSCGHDTGDSPAVSWLAVLRHSAPQIFDVQDDTQGARRLRLCAKEWIVTCSLFCIQWQ